MKKGFVAAILLALMSGCASTADLSGAKASERGRIDSKNVQNLASRKEVYIGDFQVTFVIQDASTATAKSPMMRGADMSDYAKSTLRARLSGVPEASFQSITDRAFEDFKRGLQAKGYTILNPAGLASQSSWSKLSTQSSPNPPYNKVLDNDSLMTDLFGGRPHDITFAPTGMSLLKIDGGGQYQGGVAKTADKLGKPIINARYTVHFAYFGTETDYTVDYLTSDVWEGQRKATLSAQSSMGQGIQVTPGGALVFVIDQGGTFSKNGFVALDDPVVIGGAYGRNEDTTSGAQKTANAVSSVLGFFSGNSAKTKEISVVANPQHYQMGALKALTEANARLLRPL